MCSTEQLMGPLELRQVRPPASAAGARPATERQRQGLDALACSRPRGNPPGGQDSRPGSCCLTCVPANNRPTVRTLLRRVGGDKMEARALIAYSTRALMET